MSFGVTATIVGSLAVAGATAYAGYSQAEAAKQASKAQADAADAGITEQKRQFDKVQELLNPYVQAGTKALTAQQDLAGQNGYEAQQKAIETVRSGPEFQTLVQSGQNSILQAASATGGLRGGNTQAAMGQLSPAILSSLLDKQYSRLGGLSAQGQNAAAGVGAAGQSEASQVAELLAQQGQAVAGGQLAAGQAAATPLNAIMAGLGTYTGLKGKF